MAACRLDDSAGDPFKFTQGFSAQAPGQAYAGEMEFFYGESKRTLAISASAVSGFVASFTRLWKISGRHVRRCLQIVTNSASRLEPQFGPCPGCGAHSRSAPKRILLLAA